VHPRIPCLAALVLTVLFASRRADAHPVPVFRVQIGEQAPPADAIEHVVAALGTEALSGRELASRLQTRFGAVPPSDDPLAAMRARVEHGMQLYYAGPSRYTLAEQALRETTDALLGDPVALESRADNREALARAMFGRVRIALERRQSESVQTLLRTLAEFDPTLTPDEREVPPHVVAMFRRTATEVIANARAEIRIDAAGSTPCTAWLDGRRVGSTPAIARGIGPGVHRAAVECNGIRSRWRSIEVGTAAVASVQFDARIERVLAPSTDATLRYPSEQEARDSLVDDLAALGEALGVRRIAAVQPSAGARPRLMLIDVRTRALAETREVAPGLTLRPAGAPPAPERVRTRRPARSSGYVGGLHPLTLVFGAGMVAGLAGGLTAEAVVHGAQSPEASTVRAVEFMAFGFAGACLLGTTLTALVLREDAEPEPAPPRVSVVPSLTGAWIGVSGEF
jgi:hypothetical protein